jgi:capsular polysaccharide biosynthesis protein
MNPQLITLAIVTSIIALLIAAYFYAIFVPPNYTGIANTTIKNDRAGKVSRSDMQAIRESVQTQKKLREKMMEEQHNQNNS